MGRFLPAAFAALLLFSTDSFAQSTFGNALTLTGDTSYVDVGNHPNHDFPAEVDFTITCWFRTPSDARQRLLYRFDIQSVNGYALFVDFGRVSGTIWTPGGAISVQHPPTFGPEDPYDDNEWHHVAFGKQGSELGMLIDGETIVFRDDAPAINIINTASLTIGADVVPEDFFFFEGQIDEVRMWNRALTVDQIRATMFDTLGPEYYATPDSGLVAYYRFDSLEDLGVGAEGPNDVRDFSVFQRHGDLVGSATFEPTEDEDFSRPRLTLIFQEIGAPHFGEKFEIRVTDQEDGREVGRHTVNSIDRNDIEVWLNAIIVGHSYTVDFYADHNKNGRYDAPPADHAWRMMLDPAAGNDTLTFVHNINFTDIGWPPLLDFAVYAAIWKGLATSSEGYEVELTATANVDAENGTLNGVLQMSGALGFLDLIQLYFGGTFSANADSGSVTVSDTSPGKRDDRAWTGTVSYSNSGRITSDVEFEVMGISGSIAFEGTVGRTQAIASYQIDPLDISGTALMREDTVLTKSLTSSRGDGLPAREVFLEQNYPNPFRPSTQIPFEMPEVGSVEIALYDLLGRRVATLLDGYRGAGRHVITFDGSALSTGIYTYKMTARLSSGRQIEESRHLAVFR